MRSPTAETTVVACDVVWLRVFAFMSVLQTKCYGTNVCDSVVQMRET